MRALNTVVRAPFHVVAQIVKAELIVGSVGNITAVSLDSRLCIHI